jgi:hypothetical protein
MTLAILGIILALVGLVLTIIGLPWFKRPIEDAVRTLRILYLVKSFRIRARRDPLVVARAMRKGNSSDSPNDLEMVEWRHEIAVDCDGNGRASAECIVVNIKDEVATEIKFPLWVDYCEQCHASHLESLDCWARIGQASYALIPEVWSTSEKIGFLRIPFPVPLQPNGNLRIRWGYYLPHLYSHEGAHWFEWYARRPHSRFRVALKFDEAWQPENVNSTSIPETANVPPAKIRRNAIYFSVKSPRPGRKYRIDFQLSRRVSVSHH